MKYSLSAEDTILWSLVPFSLLGDCYIKVLLGNAYQYFLIFLFCVIIIKYLVLTNIRSNEIKPLIVLVLLISSIYLFRIIKGYGMSIGAFFSLFTQISILFIFAIAIRTKKWEKLRLICNVLNIIIIVNFLSIIIFPGGIYKTVYADNWFLGYKNIMIRTLLPSLALNCIVSYHTNGHFKLKDYILFGIVLASILLSGSSTSIVVLAVFGIFIFLSTHFKHKFIPNLKIIIIVSLILSISVAFFEFQNLFSDYISKYFGKDTTLTGRVFIWEAVISLFKESPFIGYGYHNGEEWIKIINFTFADSRVSVSHPHNYFLYCLLQGGILYIIMLVVVSFYIDKHFINNYKNDEICILLAMYIAFFVEGITESLTSAPLFIPLLAFFSSLKGRPRRHVHIMLRKYK